ncbi:MAG: DUF896 domain-containing protein [Oscillospiraceae bacterium]|nr:DUF896 domain-containing protein [Oscillospiraceae bacterium]
MIQSKLDRINELARLKKERELTAEELAEQAALRKEYIEEWRASTISLLENTYVVDEKGNKAPLARKNIKRS